MPAQARRTIWGIALNDYESTFAVAAGDRKVRLYNYKNNNCQLIKTFEDFTGPVVKVAFINQGEQLMCLQNDGILKLVNILNQEVVFTLNFTEQVQQEQSDFWFKA